MKTDNRKRIIFLMSLFIIIFLSISLYLLFFQLVKADKLSKNPNNRRNFVDEENIERGLIKDRNKVILVNNRIEDGKELRIQKYPELYSQIIGYESEKYGLSGLEKSYNFYLLDIQDKDPLNKLRKSISGNKIGNDLILTLDNDLQKIAYDLMENYKGSVVVMKPSTGEVLAMTSNPSFNSNELDKNWDRILADKNSPLINRATNGQYTPGSIIKVVSSIAVLESKVDQTFDDKGKIEIDGYEFKNFESKAYGKIGLKEALMNSSNTYFAAKSQAIGGNKFKEIFNRFNFNENLPFDIGTSPSKSFFSEDMDKTEIAAASFGQGKTLVSPLHMAMVISSISNDGIMKEPYLVEECISPEGRVKYKHEDRILSRVCEKENSEILKKYLRAVIKDRSLVDLKGHEVCGKTGTAENASGKSHSWFIGFVDKEDIAIAVILEESNLTGSQGAAKVASKLLSSYLVK